MSEAAMSAAPAGDEMLLPHVEQAGAEDTTPGAKGSEPQILPLSIDGSDLLPGQDDATCGVTSSSNVERCNFLGKLPSKFWRMVVLTLVMIWATNFATIKEITEQPGVTTKLYLVSRFLLAGMSLFPFAFCMSSRKALWKAIECGSWVALGYIGQAIGLKTTTAAKSCFICSLCSMYVSAYITLIKKQLDITTIIASFLAVCGVAILELAGSQHFVIGDLISLAMPIGFGMGYIRLEQIMADNPRDALPVASVQLLCVAGASVGEYILANGELPDFTPVLRSTTALQGLLWTGIVTTALSLIVQAVAFRYVDAASAAVIFTTEPLWAALFAVWLIGEPFSFVDGIGGFLVVLACVLKEVPPSKLPWNRSARQLDIGPATVEITTTSSNV